MSSNPRPQQRRHAASSATASATASTSASTSTSTASISTYIRYLQTIIYFLIPANFPYYEVAVEGIHSLSQLVPYVSTTVIQLYHNSRSTVTPEAIESRGYSELEYHLRILTKIISYIEVFAERVSQIFTTDPTITNTYASATILAIEGLKSICRLIIIADRRKPSMMIHWCSNDSSNNRDLVHYRNYYRAGVHSYHTEESIDALSIPLILHTPDSNGSGTSNSSYASKRAQYIGRRSSIAIPLMFQINTNTPSDRAAADDSVIPDPPSNDTDSSTSSPSATSSANSTRDFLFTADQALVVAECLYILRPSIYAWALHYIASKKKSNTNTTTASNNAGDSPTPPPLASSGDSSQLRSNTYRLNTIDNALALALSLVVELFSIQLTSIALSMTRENALQNYTCNSPSNDSRRNSSSRLHVFDRELNRRRLALACYLIRSPLFDHTTLQMLSKAGKLLLHIPIINMLPNYALNMLLYLNECHFYNSNSS